VLSMQDGARDLINNDIANFSEYYGKQKENLCMGKFISVLKIVVGALNIYMLRRIFFSNF
jgi:hypothetical protein